MVRPLLLLALAACVPAPLDYSGKRCAPDRPCPDGYGCEAGVCLVPNLLANGDFEFSTAGWEANGPLSRVAPGHGDAGSALQVRGTSSDAGAEIEVRPTQTVPSGNDPVRHCLAAWVAGSAEVDGSLGLQQTDLTGQSHTFTLAAAWQEVRVELDVPAQQRLAVVVSAPLGETEALQLDDVRLWRSASGACSER